ncbi:NAD(P)H-nitrite reductase [Leptospira perolatii]|uniref:NAD(P)H-nitrite reductase n=1 Tax=Leptospira perolatii TaxID=2023191 RepID=A0A2M9ZRZ1_9LEPT|nr:nitrate reductase [Leptospira perolatii]PJZ71206.1 NAD(P)H-nitrite reductase [Leptospira perolatii]PJZ74739.1 NAD(P)H-nitrite reductase [Leptospira perolatii]
MLNVKSVETHPSTCSYCGVGCGVLLHKHNDQKLSVEGDPNHPANRGLLCSKGMNLHYALLDRSDRLLYPMMREHRNSELKEVTWEAALNRAALEFRKIINEHGPDSVGFYVSGQLLTEEYYIINKLTKGFLGTNNIDTNSRLCMSSAVVGYKMALGEDSVPVCYEDIELADCFLIAGANPAWCHPILFRRIEARKKENPNDVKIIVVDPRRTESCEDADLHLQINPGTDIYLFNAIARILIETNQINNDFIKNHTEGFSELKEKVFQTDLQTSAGLCGVPTESIVKAANLIGSSKGFLSLWAMGLNQSVVGVNKNLALLNLSLITGKIGKPGNGPFSLTGQPNAMGGREVGGLCNLLPAHRNLQNPEHRKEVATFWGVNSIQEKPGYSATEMFENLTSGKMKAIWIVCTNPTVSLPDARTVESGLRSADFVVVQDISKDSGAVPFADLVLPAAGWAEKQGTMTNSDRRITYLPKAIEPPGEAVADTMIIRDFAHKMGYAPSFDYKDEEEVFLEYCRITSGTNIDITGLDYSILKERRSVQWPFPDKDHEGTPRLFTDGKFFRPSGLAKIHDVNPEDPSEKPTPDFPLTLTTGRIRDQWHTMTRTGKVRKLREHRREPYLEIHPENAKVREIEEGSIVEVKNSRGLVRVRAKVTEEIKENTVFLPMHWGRKNGRDDSRANNLTSKEYDPFSKQPGFKISSVEVKLFKKQKEKVLIIGGGNGTLAFLKAYRQLAPEDEISLLCKEENPFYNRILLPDYISGEKQFGDLLAIDQEEIDSWNLEVFSGTAVEELLPEAKKVKDSNGILHSYNKLILATGSSASIPKSIPPEMDGIFSLRGKADAEKIRGFFVPDSHALIVGGGLLGLELAAALKSNGVLVTILVRTDRLMSKQLDPIASAILKDEILDRGINILFNSQISKIKGTTRVMSVKLSDGSEIIPDGIVYATGTTPNIGLANSAGLQCNSGVLVNPWLQTSDPDIYAIGEVAEHESGLYGTVAATEEQARIAANHIFGYAHQAYEGSLHTNLLKIPGLDLVSLRRPDAVMDLEDDETGEFEEVTLLDRKLRKYKKCVIKGDRLVGAILIGDKSEFSTFKELISSGLELGEKRASLLSGGGLVTKPIKGKLVCSCNGVGDGNIREEIGKGLCSIEDLGKATGAGTGCGSCRPEISKILKESSKADIRA